MKRKQTKSTVSTVARGGLIAALSVALLFIGQFLEIFSLTVSAAASLLVLLILLEYGWKHALTVYFAVSVLSFVLMPSNSATVSYILILGWYPIYKFLLEKKLKIRPLCYLIKIVTVLAAFLLLIVLYFDLFIADTDFSTLANQIATFFSAEENRIAVWLDEKWILGISHAQGIFLIIYLALVPIFTLLYDLLLTRAVAFYAFRLRPILKKSKLI